ncbi:gp79 [Mycobacterium phage Bxb1]|uniref:Uncharacterized protein n=1 Tax=Mycobacterium phage Bxb1 TaxID=2902907 RepID=Q9B042_BPMB1|nr:gp79 [Mycobacterium phage Bxb1]AAG59784.1 hypothetical protein PBI_BXB1_79 [Mycobacterium phage Bxb1]
MTLMQIPRNAEPRPTTYFEVQLLSRCTWLRRAGTSRQVRSADITALTVFDSRLLTLT